MAYNEILANRVREVFATLEHVEEKEMMGGLTFMYHNKMCVGIIKDELMCRVNPDIHESLVEEHGCRTMDFTKKPMKGFVMIENEALQSEKTFNRYISLALEFNAQAKSSKKTKKK